VAMGDAEFAQSAGRVLSRGDRHYHRWLGGEFGEPYRMAAKREATGRRDGFKSSPSSVTSTSASG
jgi:hypothetical protein